MTPLDCLRPPEKPIAPARASANLREFARRRGIDVKDVDLSGAPSEAAGMPLAGTVGAANGRHVAYIHPEQGPRDLARTTAHELSHLVLEFGPKPPPSGGVGIPHDLAEARAEATEDLFSTAMGWAPVYERRDLLETVERVGWQPVVAACMLAAAARGEGT